MLHTQRGPQADRTSSRRCSRACATAKRELRHPLRRDPVRHPQHRARVVAAHGRARASPTRTAAWSASTSPAPSTTTRPRTTSDAFQLDPRQQHQLHHPRRRGLRPGVDRAGDPRLRRAPHRPRLPAARERRPAPLRQRPPHPARGLPVVERADRRGARAARRTRSDFYFDFGLRVTINTDNRLITDTTVSKELWLCHQHFGWGLDTIKDDHRRRLQERVPAVPREGRPAQGGHRRARPASRSRRTGDATCRARSRRRSTRFPSCGTTEPSVEPEKPPVTDISR